MQLLQLNPKQYPPSLPFMFLRNAPALHRNALVHPHNTISSFGRENIEHNHLLGVCKYRAEILQKFALVHPQNTKSSFGRETIY